MIRVTTIGGEPVELPEETACIDQFDHVACSGWPGDADTIEVLEWEPPGLPYNSTAAQIRVATADGARIILDKRVVMCLSHALFAEDESLTMFVHIGDGWPLCEIETWRARAERLERELDALRAEHERYKIAAFADKHGLLFIPAGPE